MELLQTALVIALLTITSAKPMGWRDHQDADIADKGWIPEQQDQNNWWLYQLREYNSDDDSSESSETESSESSEEVVVIVDQTTPAETTVAVTTALAEDGSTIAPEPNTIPTDAPTPMEATNPPATPTAPVDVTTMCNSGQCVIYEIPTVAPVTDNRGDN